MIFLMNLENSEKPQQSKRENLLEKLKIDTPS
jgi:hypothetical protein